MYVYGVSSLCWGELFVSVPAICHPTIPHVSAVLPLRAHAHSMSINRATLGASIGAFVTVIYIPTHPYIYVYRGSIFPKIPGVTFRVGDFAHTTMTSTRQHENTTTLRVQPYRTAAVGYVMYVRVACPRYAVARRFCRSLSSVTPPYRIFLLCCRCVGVL